MSGKKLSMNVIVLAIILRDNRILMMRRANTGWLDGYYDLVAGHVDGNETLAHALSREVKEEVGISVDDEHANFVHLLHYIDSTEYIYAFFAVDQWQGEPVIMEPHKCDNLEWFDLDDLPENTAPATKHALVSINDGILSSEFK